MDIDLKQLRDLMRAVKQFDLTSLVLEKNGERIEMRRAGSGSYNAIAIPGQPIQTFAPRAQTTLEPGSSRLTELEEKELAKEAEAGFVYATSPFVGTFFRSPTPGEPPYVEVGQKVSAGQTLCIVEAMKLMNEIESEYSGTIAEVLADNGKPVEYGDRLFKIRLG
jgi:acetyl-CoA carboxylase biotin carboxyl carrier protein